MGVVESHRQVGMTLLREIARPNINATIWSMKLFQVISENSGKPTCSPSNQGWVEWNTCLGCCKALLSLASSLPPLMCYVVAWSGLLLGNSIAHNTSPTAILVSRPQLVNQIIVGNKEEAQASILFFEFAKISPKDVRESNASLAIKMWAVWSGFNWTV